MNILSEIIRGIWMIDPVEAESYYPLVHKILSGQFDPNGPPPKSLPDQMPGQSSIFGGASPSIVDANILYHDPESIPDNSLFVVNIAGPITKYSQLCGPSGTSVKSQWLTDADNHPGISAHLLRIDSGGGEAHGAYQMAKLIGSLSKPVFGFVDGIAASAAYLIASQCDYIVCSTKMDRVGSIGTFVTIADFRQYYKRRGIDIHHVYAQMSTEKNKDYLAALDGDTSKIQEIVDKYNDLLLEAVSEARSHYLTSDSWKTGRMFFAPEAVSQGLIDDILPFDQFLMSLLREIKHIEKPSVSRLKNPRV